MPPASASTSSQTWNYDDTGNWQSTTKTIAGNNTTENRTHSDSDQITSITGNAAAHDAKGNLTEYEINTKQYEVDYDLENRIIKVDVNNSDVEYRYDALGRRVIRKEGSTNTALLWWDSSECAEYEHSAGKATIQNDIVSDPRQLNAVVASAVDGSKFDLDFYHKNYLDHVYAVSDDNGNLDEHYRYTAFGEVTIYNSAGTIQTTSQINNTILWNTRRLDTVSNYYLYKYRHYDPALGRWPSRDPIEEDGGVNLYAFAGNDPVASIDILGLEWEKVEGTPHTWCANEDTDTLDDLAIQYEDAGGWSCLWPTEDTKDNGYKNKKVKAGDKYDASNLAIPAPNQVKLQYLVSLSLRRSYPRIFPGILLIHASWTANLIKFMSGEGATPIKTLILAGHGNDIKSGFSPRMLLHLSKEPEFNRAQEKKGPVRCWFTRNASVTFSGCNTKGLADSMASLVLRRRASAYGTNQSIGTGIRPDGTPGLSYGGTRMLDRNTGRSYMRWEHRLVPYHNAPVWEEFDGMQ